MALIAHTFLPRSMLDMDAWFRPTLDTFDPFDDLDRMMSRNLMWLDKPDFLDFSPLRLPKVPKKWRIKLDCRGYNPKSIKTEIKEGKLIISGSESNKDESNKEGDYSMREFRKTYKLPEDVETEKMVSFVTSNGQLVVEMPVKQSEKEKTNQSGPLFPQIVEGENGQKNVSVKLHLPKNIDPSKLSVTCKDRDLIIKAEDKEENQDSFSQTYFYQRTTLPENTDFNSLKCLFENNQLSITAPLNNQLKEENSKSIPIEFKNK